MAAFVGSITGVGTKRVKETAKDKDTGEVTIVRTYPELRIALATASCDVHQMEELIGDMIGKPVKVCVTLEQLELPE